ncbi:MAG: DUF1810 family protein, partial [Fimbriimonadaceae bacterium]|nr:DUF1810 family protein [Fimbriimonadaceae bacterium]
THNDRALDEIFEEPDDTKFKSCMTLFDLASEQPDNIFRQQLDRFCGGRSDQRTISRITD